jgi:hypothetical protein
MKTLITSALLCFALLNVSATEVPVVKDTKHVLSKELKQQLDRHMIAPIFDDGKDMTGLVDASFVVNKDGTIKILSLRSQNSALLEYVERKLMKVKVSGNEDGFWKTTSLKFIFKKEG